METTKNAKVESVDMKLEVVVLGVSDVDRAKAFYQNLGWRLDIDIAAGDFRGVQMTPHNSEASIIFGKGITSAKPGSADNLTLAVDAGASGFLCGRAIWKDVMPRYPDLGSMRIFLQREAATNFLRANAAAELARPWYAHPSHGGWDQVGLTDAGEEWYRHYRAETAKVR